MLGPSDADLEMELSWSTGEEILPAGWERSLHGDLGLSGDGCMSGSDWGHHQGHGREHEVTK